MTTEPIHLAVQEVFPQPPVRPFGLKATVSTSTGERALPSGVGGRAFFCWLKDTGLQSRNLNAFGLKRIGLSPGYQGSFFTQIHQLKDFGVNQNCILMKEKKFLIWTELKAM